MAKYSAVVMEHFLAPRNHGPLEDYDYEGNATLPGQSAFMRVYLHVEGDTIERASFVTFGCGAAIATGSMLTEMIKGREVSACLAMTADEVDLAMGTLPGDKKFCVGLAMTALRKALEQI